MKQSRLPFKFEESKRESGITALAGLPAYLNLAFVTGLIESTEKHVKVREDSPGWTDSEVIHALILLNLAGGECVEDIKKLEGDRGFRKIVRKIATHGMSTKEKKAYKKRWHREKSRGVPSPSGILRYLNTFHDVEQEEVREEVREELRAFIPKADEIMSPNRSGRRSVLCPTPWDIRRMVPPIDL